MKDDDIVHLVESTVSKVVTSCVVETVLEEFGLRHDYGHIEINACSSNKKCTEFLALVVGNVSDFARTFYETHFSRVEDPSRTEELFAEKFPHISGYIRNYCSLREMCCTMVINLAREHAQRDFNSLIEQVTAFKQLDAQQLKKMLTDLDRQVQRELADPSSRHETSKETQWYDDDDDGNI